MLFTTLGPSSLPIVVAQPDERHANRIASVKWYDRHKAYNIWFKRRKSRDILLCANHPKLRHYIVQKTVKKKIHIEHFSQCFFYF